MKLVGPGMQKYHIRTRDGYRLMPQTQINTGTDLATGGGASVDTAMKKCERRFADKKSRGELRAFRETKF